MQNILLIKYIMNMILYQLIFFLLLIFFFHIQLINLIKEYILNNTKYNHLFLKEKKKIKVKNHNYDL